MRKQIGVVMAVAALVLAGVGNASAFSLPGGTYHTKITDATSLYAGAGAGTLGAPVTSAFGIALGEVLRGIGNQTTIQSHPGDVVVPASQFNTATEEITSIFYDLALTRISPILLGFSQLGFSAGGLFPFTDTIAPTGPLAHLVPGAGGHLDLFLGTGVTRNYTSSGGSSGFGPGGQAVTAAKPAGGDAYSVVTDGALIAEGVFMPLPVGLSGFCPLCVAGEVLVANIFFSPTGTILTGSTAFGFANVIGGTFGGQILEGGIPADVLTGYSPFLTPAMAAALGYDVSVELKFAAPPAVGGGATAWLASSEDPLHFTLVPNPSGLVLLGTGLAGLAFGARVIRRKK